ncbi:hypothetical protein PT277_03450 [Acetobacteraceae bacterium ESL0709]|nr:hypothetical protein [Acetobacteraceae bacterium ESL0709]
MRLRSPDRKAGHVRTPPSDRRAFFGGRMRIFGFIRYVSFPGDGFLVSLAAMIFA